MQTDIIITEIDPTVQSAPPPAELTTAEYLKALEDRVASVIAMSGTTEVIENFLKKHGTAPLKSVDAYPMFQRLAGWSSDYQTEQLAVIRLLCNHGLDPNNRAEETELPVLFTAMNSDPCDKLIEMLLACGADPNVVYRECNPQLGHVREWKPLGWAIGLKDGTARQLIDAGANKKDWLLKKEGFEISGFWLAVIWKDPEWARLFLPTCDLVNELDDFKQHFDLLSSLDKKSARQLQWFLEATKANFGFHINADNISEMVLRDPRFITYLEKKIAIKQYCEGLMAAVNTNSIKVVDEFVKSHEKDIAILKSAQAYAALTKVIEQDSLEIVTYLLEQGLEPNNRPCNRTQSLLVNLHMPALTVAIIQKGAENTQAIREVLLAHGADPNAVYQPPRPPVGELPVSPLWYAAQTADYALGERLLKAGADPNRKIPCFPAQRMQRIGHDVSYFSLPPIHIAASIGDERAVRFLLACKGIELERECYVTPNAWDIVSDRTSELQEGDTRTPLMLAAEQGHVAVIEALLVAGAKVNHTNGRGESALMLAAKTGKLNAVNELLARGADVTLVNTIGKSAYALATTDAIKLAIEQHYRSDVKVTFLLGMSQQHSVEQNNAMTIDQAGASALALETNNSPEVQSNTSSAVQSPTPLIAEFVTPVISDLNLTNKMVIDEFLSGDPAVVPPGDFIDETLINPPLAGLPVWRVYRP